MRKTGLGLVVGCMLIMASASTSWACECSGSGCTAKADSCPDGCYAVCGSGGCSAGCVGGGGGGQFPIKGAINFAVQGVSASELRDRLSDQLGGKQLLFVASDPTAPFSVELRQVSPKDILNALSKHGAVALVEGTTVGKGDKRSGNPLDLRLSLRAEEIEAETVVKLLRDLLGNSGTIRAENPTGRISLDLQGASLRNLQGVLWKIAGIWINPAES